MSGPVRIQPDPEAIPDALREREQWVCWRVEMRDGDPTKLPIDAATGDMASSTDPDTWTDFATAWARYTDPEARSAGIGFVFSDADPFVGVDLDDCRDPEGPSVDPWAREIVTTLETYAEVSPSGTGVHAILRGSVPDGGNRSGDVEIYDSARYFTVTGAHLGVTPATVEERQDALESVHAEHIADAGGDEAAHVDENPGGTPTTTDLDDAEIIEKAKDAKNGDKFRRLWSGDTSGYPSHSEADLALCGLLAFWTGGDRSLIDTLFRRSGLHREKWDRDDYRESTIDKALAGRSEFYEPPDHDSRGGADANDAPTDPYEAAKAEYEAVTDAGRAYAAWSVLRDEIDVLAVQPGGSIYACRDGVWHDDGKQLLRERAHGLMRTEFSRNVIEELVEQVRATKPVPIDDMGTPARTVAVANGLLDLETRDLRDLEPEDRALAQLPVEYDPEATCPEWERFIGESVEPDRIDAVQEYVGYCLLTGELPFARVLLLVGGGSNGKTTFLNVITELLGPENTTGYSLGDLVHSEYYVAQMHGAIANIDADVTGGIGHGGMFKKLTGGDRKVSARKPYGEPFDYHPTTKQLYAANEVPDTKVDDDAFFRRWLIVEFPTEFTDPDLPGPDKNPGLESALIDELPGILNWALDGLDRLLEQEHFTNEGTTDDKRERWRNWGDSVERFISECINAEGEEKHRTGDIYEAYTAWCAQHGETAESQQTLTAAIKKLDGVQYSRAFRFHGKQERGFKGLAITAEAPPPTNGDPEGLQQTFTQDTAVRRVHEVVADLAESNDDGAVPVDDVVDALDGQIGDRDPHHLIENGLKAGEFYEPQEGWIRPT